MKRSDVEEKVVSIIESFFHDKDPKYGFLAEYIMEEVDKHMVPKTSGKHQTSYDIAMGNQCEWDKSE